MRRLSWWHLTALLLVNAALSWVLLFVMHAPLWFACLAAFAIGWVWPLPKRPPTLCHMCVRGLHPHELDGRCIAGYCECAVREPALDGETR